MEHKLKDLYKLVFPEDNKKMGLGYHHFHSHNNSYRKGNTQKKQHRARKKVNYAGIREAVAQATQRERERRIEREGH